MKPVVIKKVNVIICDYGGLMFASRSWTKICEIWKVSSDERSWDLACPFNGTSMQLAPRGTDVSVDKLD